MPFLDEQNVHDFENTALEKAQFEPQGSSESQLLKTETNQVANLNEVNAEPEEKNKNGK